MSDGTVDGGAGNHGAGGIGGLPGMPGADGGPHRGWVAALVCGLLPAALLATTVAVPAALWSRLPERVADHWTLAGTADGTASRLAPFVLLGAISLVGAGLTGFGWIAVRRGTRGGWSRPGRSLGSPGIRGAAGARGRAPAAGAASWLVATGLYVMAVDAGSAIMVAVANLGGGGLKSASVGACGLVGMIGGPAVLVGFAGYVLHRYGGLGAADSGAPRSSLGLRAGERAVWTGRADARWALPAGLLLAAGGVLLGAVTGQWTPATVLLLAGVLMLGFTSVRVRVTARGVTVNYGVLGLRLTRVPLRKIASAEAVGLTAFAFGYRGSLWLLGAAAVVLRRGPALRLTLRDGKTFLVTVDDAATGAALLNDLIAQAG
jgi:hypothetical protein